jgi:GT2 family glycosyltransferase
MVGGRAEIVGETSLARTIAVAISTRFGAGGAAFRHAAREQDVDTVFMGVCSRKTYELVGGLDEELVRCQDDELSYRLLGRGGRILFSPDIHSTYHSRSTLRGIWRQYQQYGFWKVRVMQKHPKQMQPRQFVPALFVFSLVVALVFWLLVSWGWAAFALVGGGYVLADLGASAVAAAKRGWEHLTLLPLVFVILHLSYGLGFLAGLIRFWNRWGDKQGTVPDFGQWKEEAG